MISIGIDVGASTTKVVIRNHGLTLPRVVTIASQGEPAESLASRAIGEALKVNGVPNSEALYVVATGAGGEAVRTANKQAGLVMCLAHAAMELAPAVRTVVDIGAEKCLALRMDEQGRAKSFSLNDKCAAGSGLLIEMIAQMLRINVADLGPLCLESHETIKMDSTCAVFMESEAVSLIHRGARPADVASAIVNAVANRAFGVVLKAGLQPPMMLCGGVVKNGAIVKALRTQSEGEVIVPAEPQLVAALGASIIAERLGVAK